MDTEKGDNQRTGFPLAGIEYSLKRWDSKGVQRLEKSCSTEPSTAFALIGPTFAVRASCLIRLDVTSEPWRGVPSDRVYGHT
jgi:hypothetical protein